MRAVIARLRVRGTNTSKAVLTTKKHYPNTNSAKAMVQRQQYAFVLMKLLEEGKWVINVHETWLNESSFLRRV